jgi:hypothetical protein
MTFVEVVHTRIQGFVEVVTTDLGLQTGTSHSIPNRVGKSHEGQDDTASSQFLL